MRLHGLDLARFLAFFGMVLVNFRIAAGVAEGGGLASTLITSLEGRAAALFVILAGIGLGLARPNPWVTAKRGLFLIVLGLINLTIFEADILHFYGIYFLLALPVLTLPARHLTAAAVGVTLCAFAALLLGDYEAGWNFDTFEYADFWTASGLLRHTFYNGWHPVLPWIAFLFVGMALSRLPLGDRTIQQRLVRWGGMGLIAGLIPGWIHTALNGGEDLGYILAAQAIPPTPFYILSATGSAMLMIALCLWVAQRLTRADGQITPALRPVQLAGQQTLTLYLAHILIGMGLLEGLGLLDGSLTAPQILAYGIGFCVTCLIYAAFWSRLAKRGPMEVLMRRITG